MSIAGCLGDDTEAPEEDNIIFVGTSDQPTSFVPNELTVPVGTEVTWEWRTVNHNIVPTSQPEDADWDGHPAVMDPEHEYSHTFDIPGTYEYVCEPHENQGMVGTLHVQE